MTCIICVNELPFPIFLIFKFNHERLKINSTKNRIFCDFSGVFVMFSIASQRGLEKEILRNHDPVVSKIARPREMALGFYENIDTKNKLNVTINYLFK